MGCNFFVTRMATHADWSEVWPLIHQRGASDSEELAKSRYLKYATSDDHVIVLGLVENRIVGYAWAQNFGPHLRTGKVLHRFHDLFVLEKYRNCGVARAMFEQIQDWSRKSGANWLQWNANPSSTGFYERLGFKSIPEEEEGFPFFEITY